MQRSMPAWAALQLCLLQCLAPTHGLELRHDAGKSLGPRNRRETFAADEIFTLNASQAIPPSNLSNLTVWIVAVKCMWMHPLFDSVR